jgi:hypothetical protein
MKTLKILFFCLLATTASAQSKHKTTIKSSIKTETEAKSTDFEVVEKVHYSIAGCGKKPPNGEKCGQPTIQNYRFSIKPLAEGIEILSVNYGKGAIKSHYKGIQPAYEILAFGTKVENIPVPLGDFSKIKVVFEYKKNGIKKRFVVTNFTTDHHKRG